MANVDGINPGMTSNTKKVAIAAGVAAGIVGLGALAYHAPDKFIKKATAAEGETLKFTKKVGNFIYDKTSAFKKIANDCGNWVKKLFHKAEKEAPAAE